jgi:hypothetical protein
MASAAPGEGASAPGGASAAGSGIREISAEDVAKIVDFLHGSLGRDPMYPGFKHDQIKGIIVTTGAEGKNMSAKKYANEEAVFGAAASARGNAANSNARYATAKNLKSYANQPRLIFTVHIILANGNKIMLSYNLDEAALFKFQEELSDPGYISSLFTKSSKGVSDGFKKDLGQIIGMFMKHGRVTMVGHGGRRRKSRRRSTKHRKTKRR